MSLGPPPGIQPASLFRLLIAKPRPSLDIKYRFRGALDARLSVRGMRGVEEGAILDRVGSIELEAVRTSRTIAEYVAVSLHSGGKRVFSSAKQVGMLTAGEAKELGAEVLDAIQTISPTYPRSDTKQWAVVLERGAVSSYNIAESELMSSMQDYVIGKKAYPLERPDRYFGMAASELTDGQLMVYRAGVKAIKDLRGTSD